MKRKTLLSHLATGVILGTTIAQAQIALPVVSKVTADKTKPGFLWRIFANSANKDNTNAKSELALTGQLKGSDGTALPNLADNTIQGAAIAAAKIPSSPTAPLEFAIESVINLDKVEGSASGNFTPDLQMPGIPATDGSSEGFAVEIITYLDLPAGVITLGVNSDDGFRTTAGNLSDAFQSVRLGEYDGGRGTSDTTYSFTVTEAGVYPFRTTYEQGGGGAAVEWFSVKADGTKVLLNDTANGGIKAYRAAVAAPTPIHIVSVSPDPAPRQMNKVSSSVSLVLADGDAEAIDDAAVSFKIDGNTVTNKVRTGTTLTLTYTPAGIQFPSESHSAELVIKGKSGTTRTEKWAFRNLKNVILPTPVATENFDSTAEGKQPAGWVATNFTVDCTDGEDINDQKSATYKNWVVISTNTIPSVDDYFITDVNPNETVNGKKLTIEMLASQNVLYAESDSRCNGSRQNVIDGSETAFGQTQFIVSKPFDLTLVKNPVLSFTSGYVQNQDSYGGVEYSVDGGKTFLPIVYFLDSPDIVVKADGTTDGVMTLTNIQSDSSLWTDKGVLKGKAYGDAAAAPIVEGIGDYIVPRINDDGIEGKRIEIFRLPAAANKADVRLRLSATGSDSWYFFVDNIAFYDIAPPAAPSLATVLSTNDLIRPTSYNTPGAEKWPNVLDKNSATKYLNFDKLNTGFTVIPAAGNTLVTGLALTSANDAPERDPSSYLLEGSNDGVKFTVISSNAAPAFTARFQRKEVAFANTTAYGMYRVTFPTVVNASTANSMQIADVELLGTATSGNLNLKFAPVPITTSVDATGKVKITYFGTLQQADVVSGPYTDVASPTYPAITVTPANGKAKFYRTKL